MKELTEYRTISIEFESGGTQFVADVYKFSVVDGFFLVTYKQKAKQVTIGWPVDQIKNWVHTTETVPMKNKLYLIQQAHGRQS